MRPEYCCLYTNTDATNIEHDHNIEHNHNHNSNNNSNNNNSNNNNKLYTANHQHQHQHRQNLHDNLHHQIRLLLLHDTQNRQELRMWFATTMGTLQPWIPREDRVHTFLALLPWNRDTLPRSNSSNNNNNNSNNSNNNQLLEELILLVLRRRPGAVGRLICNTIKGIQLLKEFFAADDRHIERWFHHFTLDGHFRYGAASLERYAFAHRDHVWHLLSWKDGRGTTPVIAAQKKLYFTQLDVIKTVHNFLHNDEFWNSDEIRDFALPGDFLSIDYMWWMERIKDWLRNDDDDEIDDVRQTIEEYIKDESFQELCQQLILCLNDQQIFWMIKNFDLNNNSNDSNDSNNNNNNSNLKHIFMNHLFKCSYDSIDTLLLYNALGNQRSRVMHLLHNAEEIQFDHIYQDIQQLIDTYNPLETRSDLKSDFDEYHSLFNRVKSKGSYIDKIRFILLETFLLHFKIQRMSTTQENCEQIMRSNNISFQPVYDEMVMVKKKRKRSKRKKKRSQQSSIFLGWRIDEGPGSRDRETSSLTGTKRKPESESRVLYNQTDIPYLLSQYYMKIMIENLMF